MSKQISDLEYNKWIRDFIGPWDTLLLLVAKPHQESCTLYVSHRALNAVTRSFEFPIPRCSDRIKNLGDLSRKLYFISLDARSGYHQIRVRECDQEKLAFFTPEEKKKCFVVMTFGPKNAPAFHTAMMKINHDERVILFHPTKYCIPSDTSISTIFCDNKTIIDDTLIFSNHIPTLFHYFSCVAQVFTKYRLLIKLSKYDFFLSRVKYVGHDLTVDGNCPAHSKFSLIKQCPLPPHRVSLLSFIGLCSFYNNYVPWFESNIKPLRRLHRLYYR